MSTKIDNDDNNRKRKIDEDNTRKRKKIKVIPKSSSFFRNQVSLEDECEEVDEQDDDDKRENENSPLKKRLKEYKETKRSIRDSSAIMLFALKEDEKSGPQGIVVDENDYQVVKEIENYRLEFEQRLQDAGAPLVIMRPTEYRCNKDNNADRRITHLYVPKIGRPLPNIILQLDALEELSLQCSEIVNVPRWFPTWLGDLTNLTTLEIELQEGQGVPDEISDLTNLKSLRIRGSCHVSFPRSIGNLTGLEKLDIDLGHRDESKDDDDPVNTPRHVSFPSSICNLINLKKITLCVDDIPDEIGKVPNLETLEVGCGVSSLPTSICNLKSLKNLNLRATKIESLPEEIGDLTGLETLDLNESSIESLPSSIGNLSNLKEIDLGWAAITSLPFSIGNLKELVSLYLYQTPIESLPSSIGRLKNLQELNLDFTRELRSLPSSIGKLKNLKSLDLRTSGIKSLPSSVGNLKNLKELDLDGSKIKSLPRSIGKLKNLEILDLYSTKAARKKLPDEIGNLINLTHLNLDHYASDIDELQSIMPSTMANLKNLRVLRLGGFLPDNYDYSSKLARDCQRLGCFGYPRSAENKPKCHDIVRSLAWNRARNRIGSQRRGQDLSHPPSLWPIILEKAKLAFGKDELNNRWVECWCCAEKDPEVVKTPENSQSDAIFQLLVYYGETFLPARKAALDVIPTP